MFLGTRQGHAGQGGRNEIGLVSVQGERGATRHHGKSQTIPAVRDGILGCLLSTNTPVACAQDLDHRDEGAIEAQA
jgi:hypothetical protein